MKRADRFLVILASAFGAVLPAHAASQHDLEIEKLETSYRFEANGTGQTTIHARWKVITAAGRNQLSQFSIPYQGEFEDIQITRFRTLKNDGATVEGDLMQVFDRTAPGPNGIEMFTDARTKTFLPPNLEVGDEFEYELIRHSKKSLKGNDFWLIHEQERSVPVISETVRLDLPTDLRVALHEHSSLPHRTEERDDRRIEIWDMANPESVSALDRRFEPVFAVSTILTWDAFGEWIRSLNTPSEQVTAEIRALAGKLTAGKTTERDRINALYEYVSEKIRYVSIDFGVGRIQPHAASEVLQNAYGDCKDKHALLVALLDVIGIKADTVLVTPGIGVLVPDVPIPDQFVHEFTRVQTSKGPIFVDATLQLAPAQLLAPGVRGNKALLVAGDKSNIIEIPAESPMPTRDVVKLIARIDTLGRLTGTSRMEFQGADEPAVRRVFRDGTKEQQEQFVRAISGTQSWQTTVGEIRHSDPEDLAGTFWLEYSLNDRTFFPPGEPSKRITLLGNGAYDVRALSNQQRPTQPIPVDKRDLELSIDLQVDQSYMITNDMPVHLKTTFANYDSESGYDQGHLRVNRGMKLTGAPIGPADWDTFTSFWTRVAEAESRGFLLARHSSGPTNTLNPSGRNDRIGDLLRSGGDSLRGRSFQTALNAFEEAVRLDPNSRTAWNGLGRAYAGLRQFEKAEQAYQRQIQINPKDLRSYNDLGMLRRTQGRLDEATALFRKQIEVAPGQITAHGNLTALLVLQHKWDDAVREGLVLTQMDPKNTLSWLLLGRAQAKSGKLEDASHSFDRMLEANDDPMNRNNVASELADANLDLEKAWQLISNAISVELEKVCRPARASLEETCVLQFARLASMLDTAGWVLIRQGKADEAKPLIAASYAIRPSVPSALHLASLEARAGDLDGAMALLVAASSFRVIDSSQADEVQAELAKLVGDDARFETRLSETRKQMPLLGEIPIPSPMQDDLLKAAGSYRVIALVDENGKVVEAVAESGVEPAADLLASARRLALSPVSWSGRGLPSVREIEFRFASGKLQHVLSYVVRPREPAPPSGTDAPAQ